MKTTHRKAAALLRRRRVAILGYGSQGSAQAQNLRDSGIAPIIGLPGKSKTRRLARRDRFEVVSPERAIAEAGIVAVLVPDHKHKELFGSLGPALLDGKALIFAHGLSVAFGLVALPQSCDTIMVAPHGPGLRLREMYLASQPFTSFWAVHNDSSGKAAQIGRAYAAAIGCPPSNLFPSSFREEAIGDIFGEQAVLCGGLVGLVESGFETLVRNGLSPENAYLECVQQLDLLAGLLKSFGPAGMFQRISKTAAYGSLKNKDRLFGPEMERRLQALYEQIENGSFARDLMRENETGLTSLKKELGTMKKSLLQKTHDGMTRRPS